MSQPSNQMTYGGEFPQVRLDEMRTAAKEFNASALPQAQWRLDGGKSQFDAAESAFVARQLEYMRPGIYEIQYPELKGARLVPVNTETDGGAQFITITIVDQVGQVLVSNDMSVATPMVEMKTSQQSQQVFSLRIGYAYSLQEARAAQFAGVPLNAKKAMACRGQMERKLDDMMFVGDSTGGGTGGVKGLLNQSSTLTYTVPNGAQGSKAFSTKSADEVLKDLNAAPSQVVTNSKEIWVPDTALLCLSTYEYINGARVGDGTSMSILAYYRQNNAHIRNIETSFKGETLGSSSSTRAAFYKRDPACLEFLLTQPFEQLPPQADGFMVVTLCHARTAGVGVYQPSSIIYADGF